MSVSYSTQPLLLLVYIIDRSGINKLPLQRVEKRVGQGRQLKKLNDKLFPGPEEKHGSLDKLKINIMRERERLL